MGPLRRVRSLRLRAVEESSIRHGAILIEDALRTASLPDGDGSRLVLVRSLPLGTFRASAPPAAIALLIEKCFRRLASSAVRAEDPAAPAAPAVYFRDPVEPYALLALKIARQENAQAWFWRGAVKGWLPTMPRDESLRMLLFASLQTEPGPAAGLTLVRTLLRANAVKPLLSALRHQDGTALLRACGWSVPCILAVGGREPSMAPRALQSGAVVSRLRSWGESDPRSVWLACMLLACEKPALLGSASLPGQAAGYIRCMLSSAVSEARLQARDEVPGRESGVRSPVHTAQDQVGSPKSGVRSQVHTAQDRVRGRESGVRSPVHTAQDRVRGRESGVRSPVHTAQDQVRGREPGVRSPVHTAQDEVGSPKPEVRSQTQANCSLSCRAGLFFLIHVMERVGLPKWIEEHPEATEWSLPSQILWAVARRLDALADDPALAALDPAEELAPRELLRHWMGQIRRYSRRTVRIGLYSLVCRPGRVTATPTHIDVLFRAADADIRVRKAGLDIDPGWVPWFGRVVHFHYLSAEEFNA